MGLEIAVVFGLAVDEQFAIDRPKDADVGLRFPKRCWLVNFGPRSMSAIGLLTEVTAHPLQPDAKKSRPDSGRLGSIANHSNYFDSTYKNIGGSGCKLSQRLHGASFVPLNIKHSGQSCHLEQVVYSLVQVYQPKLPTLIPNSCVGLNQFANS